MSAIIRTFKLGQPPWPTLDPFLFCVHHNDEYPAANIEMHPKSSLMGRNIGADFPERWMEHVPWHRCPGVSIPSTQRI